MRHAHRLPTGALKLRSDRAAFNRRTLRGTDVRRQFATALTCVDRTNAASRTGILTADNIRDLARQSGFELAGVAAALPVADRERYREWVAAGRAGKMGYLTDHRAAVRDDPRNLLPSARSVICVGKLYQTPWPHSTRFNDTDRGWISRYAWGEDYHEVMRRDLRRLDELLRAGAEPEYESRICVDTAPLLERSYARLAGLGWIGRNTCLINQPLGSWFFLGELLVRLRSRRTPRRPTAAAPACAAWRRVPPRRSSRGRAWTPRVASRISRSSCVARSRRSIAAGMGPHVFGCDICQDVCPWNGRAPVTGDPAFAPRHFAPPLENLAAITEEEFRAMYRGTPVSRARYSGFLRNVAVAMGNAARPEFRRPLERLATSEDAIVAEHARWALGRLKE